MHACKEPSGHSKKKIKHVREGTGKQSPSGQWECQDPKMDVLYYMRPYFMGIFPYIALKIGFTYGRYLQFRFLLHGH